MHTQVGPNNRPFLRFLRVSDKARVPVKATPESAGLDLFASESTTIKCMSRGLVNTGVRVELPPGCYGRIAPRSSLALKNCVDVGAGVIDPDYRGSICILLINQGLEDFEVREGDRIAQFILEKYEDPILVEVTELNWTVRGTGCFGSSGTRRSRYPAGG
jgi:dUTP pyrophosphatase